MKKDEARPMSRRDVVRLGLVAACGTAVKAAWPADLAPPALNWLETRLRTGAVRRLAVLFSSKESYYATHSKRAATYSIAICRVLGLNPDATRTIVMAAFLHDIGMVAVPAAILRKPSR